MGFMKDERTQRQYQKLKRKLEQKQKDVSGGNMAHGTPPPSPRKGTVIAKTMQTTAKLSIRRRT